MGDLHSPGFGLADHELLLPIIWSHPHLSCCMSRCRFLWELCGAHPAVVLCPRHWGSQGKLPGLSEWSSWVALTLSENVFAHYQGVYSTSEALARAIRWPDGILMYLFRANFEEQIFHMNNNTNSVGLPSFRGQFSFILIDRLQNIWDSKICL